MDFVFDIDGTLCFDGMSLSKEIQGILERAQSDYGHRVTFATARSYRDTIGILGDKLSLSKIIGLNGATLHENGHLVDSYYFKVTFLVLLFHIVIAIRFHILLMRSLITLLIRLLKFPLLLMLILKKGESF